MATLKTRLNDSSVEVFLQTVADDSRRRDCFTLLQIMQEVTKEKPGMWGESIVGFGNYHFKYASGREGDWFVTGFSPRKQNLTIYIMPGFAGYKEMMQQLGRHKTGISCLYVNSLKDIDSKILKEIIKNSVEYMKKMGTPKDQDTLTKK